MSEWNPETVHTIVSADDLHVSPFRGDGATYGTATWIWSVEVDGRLYVRPWHGSNSRWFAAAMSQGAGRIIAAGKTYDVAFSAADPVVNDAVDAAYRAKYAGSSYLPPMIGAGPRAATVLITPAG
ncbi:DUF2255 family protein [Microbacterium laevaniformans]|uniref:DUF2255 family protein n=1 Tax=Microbacterium laevaniformans TaxID=36807 RepID=A0A4S2CVI6_9MICO|nr:DUF2255 family protein [Microbacterium laevaniformans]TGY32927.1 DUF2255 family protein [Microbacterium laevaniformans]